MAPAGQAWLSCTCRVLHTTCLHCDYRDEAPSFRLRNLHLHGRDSRTSSCKMQPGFYRRITVGHVQLHSHSRKLCQPLPLICSNRLRLSSLSRFLWCSFLSLEGITESCNMGRTDSDIHSTNPKGHASFPHLTKAGGFHPTAFLLIV